MNIAPSSPFSQPVQDLLEHVRQKIISNQDGEVASYIPELAKANPDWFSICLVTAAGTVYETGDSRVPFTIQSISKPFVYGLALEDQGREGVLKKVGVEPTGDVFNSISLEPDTGRPKNPMINAGAIATTGLIEGRSLESRLKRVLNMFSLYAGRELEVDEAVYQSESDTGHRNRAIGHMLRNFEILTTDPMPVAELYFKQCSISLTCRDLAVMAATLANHGTNPITGKRAVQGEYVENILSVMESCGTYDFAGEWIYQVGMPAKSGVAGGIIAVLPGQLGIAVFSPRLDDHGNSVRGIETCRELSRVMDLHQLSRATMGKSTVRARLDASLFNSSRVRPAHENRLIQEYGNGIQVYQLQGNLTFSTIEPVLAQITDEMDKLTHLVFDFRRVQTINECSCRLIHLMMEKLLLRKHPTLLVNAGHVPLLRRFLKAKLEGRFDDVFLHFDDLDFALEWCEERILKSCNSHASLVVPHAPVEYELLEGLTGEELKLVQACLQRQRFVKGEQIIKTGEIAAELFFLARGRVSVFIDLPSGQRRRLASFSPGMAFGEMAAIDRAPRSAMIVADTEVECDMLTLHDMDRLAEDHPAIKIKLLENLCHSLCGKLRKANRELGVLE